MTDAYTDPHRRGSRPVTCRTATRIAHVTRATNVTHTGMAITDGAL